MNKKRKKKIIKKKRKKENKIKGENLIQRIKRRVFCKTATEI